MYSKKLVIFFLFLIIKVFANAISSASLLVTSSNYLMHFFEKSSRFYENEFKGNVLNNFTSLSVCNFKNLSHFIPISPQSKYFHLLYHNPTTILDSRIL